MVLHISPLPRTHQPYTNPSPHPLSVHAIYNNSLDVNEIISSPLESLLEEVHLTAAQEDHTQLPLDTGPHLYSCDNHGQSNRMVAFVNHIRDVHDMKFFDLTHSSNDPTEIILHPPLSLLPHSPSTLITASLENTALLRDGESLIHVDTGANGNVTCKSNELHNVVSSNVVFQTAQNWRYRSSWVYWNLIAMLHFCGPDC